MKQKIIKLSTTKYGNKLTSLTLTFHNRPIVVISVYYCLW